MAWADARARLVTIITTEATPVSIGDGVPASFRHVAEAGPETPARSRDFHIITDEVAIQGPLLRKASGRRQRLARGDIVVDYEALTNLAALDLMVVSDAEVLIDALSDPTLWDRPDSTIEIFSLFGTEEISPAVIERDDDGRARLVIPFECLYTHAAS